MQVSALRAGEEPGLRFASKLDGRGGCTDLDWAGVASWRAEDGFLWVHLERDAPEAQHFIQTQCKLDPLVAEALLAEDSRPRIEPFDDGLLVVMRGINIAEREEVELVPIHIWIDTERLISLRDRDHALSALRDIRMALKIGRGPRAAGTLLVQIAEKIGRDLDPTLDEIDAEVEQLEEQILGRASQELRRNLSEVRRRAVHMRRYLGPQREALGRLINDEDTPILTDRDRKRLRSVLDRVLRHIEDLDAFRDRTMILHEDLAAQISETIARTSNRLTGLAALLLPPGLIAGLLGANVGGIPGQDDPYAFFQMLIVVLVVVILQYALLRWMRWL